jgi:hypothetical protein
MNRTSMIALDGEGNPLPFTAGQIKDVVKRALDGGEIVLVAARTASGQIACHVFGPPSEEIADWLEQLARAYRKGITVPPHGGE